MKRSPRMLDAGRVHSFRLRQTRAKHHEQNHAMCAIMGLPPPWTFASNNSNGWNDGRQLLVAWSGFRSA